MTLDLVKQKYINEIYSQSVGVHEVHNDIDLPDELFNLFIRKEEFDNKIRDQWGLWEHPYSDNYQRGKLWYPEINKFFFENYKTNFKNVWPDNHKFALCITHDVDQISEKKTFCEKARLFNNRRVSGQKKIEAMLKTLASLTKINSYGCETEKTIKWLLDTEKKYEASASYLFHVYPSKKKSKYDCTYSFSDTYKFNKSKINVADLCKELKKQGHDVGLHGSIHSGTDYDIMAYEKDFIENILEEDIVSLRQHYLNFDIRKTPGIINKCKFQIDSTLGFNRNIGFRSGICSPYRWYDCSTKKILDFIEAPLIIQDAALFSSTALEFNLNMAKSTVNKIINQVEKYYGCCTILFHPHLFVYAEYREIYESILENAKKNGAWLCSLEQLNSHWRKKKILNGDN